MEKYSDKTLDEYVSELNDLLSAIAAKESKNLNVAKILRRDELMSFETATRIGMQENAKQAIMGLAVLATSFDRVIRMVEQMIEETAKNGCTKETHWKNPKKYEDRLNIIMDFERILKELNPPIKEGKFKEGNRKVHKMRQLLKR